MVSGTNRVGLLVNSTNPTHPGFRRSLEVAARALGVELVASEASTLDDLHAAFQRLARERVNSVLILQDTMFLNERKRIALFGHEQTSRRYLGGWLSGARSRSRSLSPGRTTRRPPGGKHI
jgi:hypothetical protein